MGIIVSCTKFSTARWKHSREGEQRQEHRVSTKKTLSSLNLPNLHPLQADN